MNIRARTIALLVGKRTCVRSPYGVQPPWPLLSRRWWRGGAIPFVIGLALILARIQFAQSESFNCEGILSNRPCTEVTPGPVGVSRPGGGDAGSDARSARFLFNEFDLRRLRAKRTHDVDVDPVVARNLCLGARADLERCRAELKGLEERLDRLVVEAKKLAAGKGGDDDDSGADQQQIIIINNNHDSWRDRHPSKGKNLYLPPADAPKFVSPTEQSEAIRERLSEMNQRQSPHRGGGNGSPEADRSGERHGSPRG